MSKVYVRFRVTGYVDAEVEVPDNVGYEINADEIANLKNEGSNKVTEMDFGPLEDINWEYKRMEDERGNLIDED